MHGNDSKMNVNNSVKASKLVYYIWSSLGQVMTSLVVSYTDRKLTLANGSHKNKASEMIFLHEVS